MPTPPQFPPPTTLQRMRREGRTLKELADMYGVTPKAVWQWVHLAGPVPPGRTVEETTGWTIAPRHRKTSVMRHLETHHRLETGQDVDPVLFVTLRQWVVDILGVDAVLDYHPDAPPNDICPLGGFYLRGREKSDTGFFRRHHPAGG